jgi:hypothetical protein
LPVPIVYPIVYQSAKSINALFFGAGSSCTGDSESVSDHIFRNGFGLHFGVDDFELLWLFDFSGM